MNRKKILKDVLILTISALAIYLYGNNVIPLTNPDEVFYAQTAREMAQHKTWLVPMLFGQPQFEKPIFSFWLFRISDIVFGLTPFAARFFPALFGAIGVLGVYAFGLLGFRDRKPALLSAIVLMSSGLYVGLAKTVFTDMFFSVLILLTLLAFYWGYDQARRPAGILLAFIFSALAVLAKGPLGFLIPCSIVIWFLRLRRDIRFALTPSMLLGLGIFCLIALPWYIFCIKTYGQSFVQEFFYNDHIRRILEAEHIENDTWSYYPLAIIYCMGPWSLFVLAGLAIFFVRLRDNSLGRFEQFLGLWILIVFISFQVAHSKLTSYIMPLFPPVALITGGILHDLIKRESVWLSRLAWGNWGLLTLLPVALLIAANLYQKYIGSWPLVYGLATSIFILCGFMAWAIRKRNFRLYFHLTAALIPVALVFAIALRSGYNSYLTSRYIVDYLLKNHTVETTLLCSKSLVRGVYYFSGKPVAVMNINGKGFFSPHPIPFFNEEPQVKEFIKSQEYTFAIFKKSDVRTFERISLNENWQVKILAEIGDEFLVEIRPASSPRLVALSEVQHKSEVETWLR